MLKIVGWPISRSARIWKVGPGGEDMPPKMRETIYYTASQLTKSISGFSRCKVWQDETTSATGEKEKSREKGFWVLVAVRIGLSRDDDMRSAWYSLLHCITKLGGVRLGGRQDAQITWINTKMRFSWSSLTLHRLVLGQRSTYRRNPHEIMRRIDLKYVGIGQQFLMISKNESAV